ncbi:hypothetical protein DPMN_115757 [Dreissena polymorpha]|uniref:Uncharacterized protein n=1 Tax=Dreissena polymorpha TaxID=45954 RepID=A0A9D4KMF4_DREPO|nr:hypothetical protein DPMN_115757 [Dreissena polymorpha]
MQHIDQGPGRSWTSIGVCHWAVKAMVNWMPSGRRPSSEPGPSPPHKMSEPRKRPGRRQRDIKTA